MTENPPKTLLIIQPWSVFSTSLPPALLTLFDDSDVIVLGVTGGVGQVGPALQGQVVPQGGEDGQGQTEEELARPDLHGSAGSAGWPGDDWGGGLCLD